MTIYYKLDENKNVLPSSLEEYSTFKEGTFPINYYHIANDIINGFRISTIFVGTAFHFENAKKPLVFETMIFNKNDEGIYQEKYSTYQDAEENHKFLVDVINAVALKDFNGFLNKTLMKANKILKINDLLQANPLHKPQNTEPTKYQ
jgi:hypothetical protein